MRPGVRCRQLIVPRRSCSQSGSDTVTGITFRKLECFSTWIRLLHHESHVRTHMASFVIFLCHFTDYDNWLDAVSYGVLSDPKGYDTVQYIKCRTACETFAQLVKCTSIIVKDTDKVSTIIEQVIDDPFKQSFRTAPDLELVWPKTLLRHEYAGRVKAISNEMSVGDADIKDGDVLCIKHKTLSEIRIPAQRLREKPAKNSIFDNVYNTVQQSVNNIIDRWLFTPALLMITIPNLYTFRDGRRFLANLLAVSDTGEVANSEEKRSWVVREQPPMLAVLYTDEDTHVASYMRTHFDDLDKASGSRCDVGFIEDPSQINACKYWRNTLSQSIYVAWRLLGWVDSLPYNKSEIYDVAARLQIPFDRLPCVATISSDRKSVIDVYQLGADLTSDFRGLFAKFQGIQSLTDRPFTSMSRHKEESQSNYYQDDKTVSSPLCFMSHSSADKQVVRAVATDLHSSGVETWFDEWEILPGDRITKKIEEGLSKATAVVVFLSPQSVRSNWMNEELHNALYQAIATGRYKILPVLLKKCDIPIILHNYAYINE